MIFVKEIVDRNHGWCVQISRKMMPKTARRIFFIEICAILRSTSLFDYKRGASSGLNQEREVAKAILGMQWPGLLYNLDIYGEKQ
jgi:hypothetical protein